MQLFSHNTERKVAGFTKRSTSINSQQGFTLMETIVAIAILTISVSTVMGAVFTSITAGRQTKNRTTAYYLAQEGTAYMRYSRDTVWKQGDNKTMLDWKQRIASRCGGSNVCQISTTQKSLSKCGSSHDACDYLQLDESNRWYQYSSGGTTRFKRSANVTFSNLDGQPDGPEEAKVSVTVSYGDGSNQRVTVTEYLYGWHDPKKQ